MHSKNAPQLFTTVLNLISLHKTSILSANALGQSIAYQNQQICNFPKKCKFEDCYCSFGTRFIEQLYWLTFNNLYGSVSRIIYFLSIYIAFIT